MIKAINNYLYNTNENNKSVKEIFIEKVDWDLKKNKKRIEKKILEECRVCINNEIERLEAIKNDSIEELNKKYEEHSKYLNQIREINKQVGGYKDESIPTRV